MSLSAVRTTFVRPRCLLFAAVSFMLCLVFLDAPANAQQQKKDQLEKPVNINVNYRIGPGDVIDVTVVKPENLSKSGIRVNEEGMIQLTMLEEDIPAACRTERELANEIKEKYKKYILNPSINVAVKEFNSTPVAFIGAVNAPGRFQLQRPVRLLELLTFVNGPNANAGRNIQVIRNPSVPRCEEKKLVKPQDDDGEIVSSNYLLANTLKGEESANPYVQAGDIISIIEAENQQAFILGNVKNAQPINLKEPVTLSKAIAMVGGTLPGAQIEKIKISRQSGELFVNLKEINKRQKEDVLLQPNDIVDVPGPKKTIWKEALKIIAPITRFPLGLPY
jgi:polysaccharide biosynthesis/export protein